MLRRILIILGAFVALLPYLGLPRSWDSVLFTLTGLAIVVLLVLGKRSAQSREGVRDESALLPRASTETIHPSRPTTRATTPLTSAAREESRRSIQPIRKATELLPKTETRRASRVSPSRSATDMLTPSAVSPTLPVSVSDTLAPTIGEVSPTSAPRSFSENKPAPLRRQKPRSAEDFLKGDSA